MTPQETYDERRVRVSAYAQLPRTSPLLVAVQPQRFVHRVAAPLLEALMRDAEEALGGEVKIASAHRRRRWRDREHYEQRMIARYKTGHMSDAQALAKGRRFIAYASPHETGLAVDFGSHGLWPTSNTVEQQRRTPFHAWLKANAWLYGWHPYKAEPWHWECPLPRANFDGEPLAPSDGPPW